MAGKGEGRQVSGAHAAGAAVTARPDHVAPVLLARQTAALGFITHWRPCNTQFRTSLTRTPTLQKRQAPIPRLTRDGLSREERMRG